MIKIDLARAIADKMGITLRQSEEIINALIEEIGTALEKGEKVQLAGFGTFSLHHREAKMGRNPKTGEEVPVPAHNYPGFKPGKGLKERVNRKEEAKAPASKPRKTRKKVDTVKSE